MPIFGRRPAAPPPLTQVPARPGGINRPTSANLDVKPPPANYIGPPITAPAPASTFNQIGGNVRRAMQTMLAGGRNPTTMKKGGKVKVSSASKRADGIATKGKTKGRIV